MAKNRRIVVEPDDDLEVVVSDLAKFYGISRVAVARLSMNNLHRTLELHKP